MSSFHPLNQLEDSTVSKTEHTRELQVEKAFKIFEEALNLHKDKQFHQCFQLYESLFKLKVISGHYDDEESFIRGIQNGGSNTMADELNYLSTNLKSLRFLIFRNRAFFYLDLLKAEVPMVPLKYKQGDTSTSEFEARKETFYTMLDDMGNALIYQEADSVLIQTLSEILLFMRAHKLARYVLEYAISSRRESDDIMGLLPLDPLMVKRHQYLIDQINARDADNINEFIDIDRQYHFLESFKHDHLLQVQDCEVPKIKVCKVKTKGEVMKWEHVTCAINEMVKSLEDKGRIETTSRSKLRDVDPYFFTSTSVDILHIQMPKEGGESDDESEPEPGLGSRVTNGSNEDEVEESSDEEGKREGTEAPEEDEKEGTEAPEEGEEEIEEGQKVNGKLPEVEPDVGDAMEVDEFERNEVNGKNGQNGKIESNGEALENGESVDKPQNSEGTPTLETQEMNGSKVSTPSGTNEPNTSTPNEANDSSTPGSKQIQRASKRLQKTELDAYSWYPDISVTPGMFEETTNFFKTINTFFNKLDLGTSDILDNIGKKFAEPETNECYVEDFITVLNSYVPHVHFDGFRESFRIKAARATNNTDKETQNVKLLEVLKSFSSNKSASNEATSMDIIASDSLLTDFLTEVNKNHCHLNDVKILLLRRLLGNHEDNTCYVCDVQWSSKLISDVRSWVIQLEEQLMQESTGVISKNIPREILNELTLSTSVFELLVDTYIEQKTKVDVAISQNIKKGFQKSLKASINVQISSISKIRNIIERWKAHINRIYFRSEDWLMNDDLGFKCYVRFKWALSYKEGADNSNFTLTKFISSQLSGLHELIQSKDPNIHIPMPNYQHITEIDLKSINLLANTITVLTMFAKILYTSDDDNDNEEATSILERTLIDSKYFTSGVNADLDVSAIASVKNLLQQSDPDMKFNLWTILFQYYHSSSDLARFQFGLERVVETVLEDLNSPRYVAMEPEAREVTLLKLITLLDEYVYSFVQCLSKTYWKLPKTDDVQLLKDTFIRFSKFFQLFYMFSLHEEAALITSRKTSLGESCPGGYEKFKGSLARVATIMILYFDALSSKASGTPVSDSRLSNASLDLLSIMHEQLGLRRLCDAGEGILLSMFQDVLLESDFSARQKDALQILFCRNHCKITSGGFTPVDHDTKTAVHLDEESVSNISKLVLPLCHNKEPLLNPPRGDLKGILDKFYEVIGDQEYDPGTVLDKNTKILTEFLNRTVITPSFIKECFYGLQKVDFFPVEDNDTARVIQGGLYYLQGILILNSFKTRRTGGAGKSLEVEHVVKLLQDDLLYGSNRVESWLLLGQAFGFLTEDDLLWTPDKLALPDKKATTANVQRKSLICYLMAINFTKSSNTKTIKLAVPELMSSFSREMFNACMAPMSMMAFKTTDVVRLIHDGFESKLVNTVDEPSLKKQFAFKIIQQCLHLAIKSNSKDCVNYYYLSKVQGKLGLPYSTVIDTLLTSCELSQKPSATNSSDLIIEPHYRLCSVVCKAVKADKLSMKEAVDILGDNIVFKGALRLDDDVTDKKVFYKYVIECLRKIQPFDKKKWQHKYHYRIAKIFVDDLSNVTQAVEEMSNLVSPKVTSKSLVQFWKPDLERPGKHFYYTFQYVTFFIDLLYKDENLSTLTLMAPRLRKSTSLMLWLNVAWEKICSCICKLTRELYAVKGNFTESFLNTPIQLFWAHSKTINESLKGKDIPEKLQPTLVLLNILTEIKKANSGFGPTSLIDDTIVALFINIYYIVPSDESENNFHIIGDSPNGKAKRLAKKDIFPCANEILKCCKREVDSLVKDKPDLLTEFVQQKEDERRAKEEQIQRSKSPDFIPIPEFRTPQPEPRTPVPEQMNGDSTVFVTPFETPKQVSIRPSNESIDLTQETPNFDLTQESPHQNIDLTIDSPQSDGDTKDRPVIVEPGTPSRGRVIIEIDETGDDSNKRVREIEDNESNKRTRGGH